MKKLYFTVWGLFALSTVSGQIVAWDFTGENTVAVSAAEVFNANIDGSNLLTRGTAAAASAGVNSFRTTGFQNNGISTTNTDYFEFTLSAVSGFALSLSSIDARFAGTGSFFAAPGVTSQFAYSLDGNTFTLIGSPVTSSSLTMPQIDLTGIAALQNVPAATIVTIRYYASGQTTTGGWGFNSASAGQYGLAIGGSLDPDDLLPVKFADIRAFEQGSGIRIEWSNMTESDVVNYEVHHSINGTDFNSLGILQATKNDGGHANYTFYDARPADGINFYRIQALEVTGKKLNSMIVRVNTRSGIRQITIYPNPVTGGQLSFHAQELPKAVYTLRIFNTSGQQLFTRSIVHTGGALSEVVQLPGLMKPGVHNLIISSSEMKMMKFFIIR